MLLVWDAIKLLYIEVFLCLYDIFAQKFYLYNKKETWSCPTAWGADDANEVLYVEPRQDWICYSQLLDWQNKKDLSVRILWDQGCLSNYFPTKIL